MSRMDRMNGLFVAFLLLLLTIPVASVGCAKSDTAAIEDTYRAWIHACNARDFDKAFKYLYADEEDKAWMISRMQDLMEYHGKVKIEKIVSVTVSGSTATMRVIGTDDNDTDEYEMSLRKVGGAWKIVPEL